MTSVGCVPIRHGYLNSFPPWRSGCWHYHRGLRQHQVREGPVDVSLLDLLTPAFVGQRRQNTRRLFDTLGSRAQCSLSLRVTDESRGVRISAGGASPSKTEAHSANAFSVRPRAAPTRGSLPGSARSLSLSGTLAAATALEREFSRSDIVTCGSQSRCLGEQVERRPTDQRGGPDDAEPVAPDSSRTTYPHDLQQAILPAKTFAKPVMVALFAAYTASVGWAISRGAVKGA